MASAESRDKGALSGLLTGVTFISALAGGIKMAESRIPRPGSDAEAVRKYWGGSRKAARYSTTVQLISVGWLARFVLSVVKLTNRAGGGALKAAAASGGALAVGSLAASATTSLLLTGNAQHDDEKAPKMADAAFNLGGPVHGVGFGLMTGALVLAGQRTGDLSKPVVITGLVSAATGIASPLYFLWEPAGWLIPIGRFTGLIVSGIAGVKLAKGRRKH
jgi:hypothetical protein